MMLPLHCLFSRITLKATIYRNFQIHHTFTAEAAGSDDLKNCIIFWKKREKINFFSYKIFFTKAL